jgi:hypothetical protein
MKSSQHLHKISTFPFDYLKLEIRHLDERTVDHNKQTTKQRIPAQDEIKPVQSKEALSQPDVLNEVTFQRKNFSWT